MSELGEFESFEKRKRLDEKGMEYWSARDFASYLGYEMPKAWENFLRVLEKVKETAKSLKLRPRDHILSVKDMLESFIRGIREKISLEYRKESVESL